MHSLFNSKEKSKEKLIEGIILKNYNRYYRLAYSYVHNEADACDIVQSGAYKSLKNAHTLKKEEYAETWIYRIMLNECFGFMKQTGFLSYEAMQDQNGTDVAVTEDHYADIDLKRALDALPERDKAVVILKYFEDKKITEIAEILDENVNTIKSRLYRSLKKLRDALSEEAIDERKLL